MSENSSSAAGRPALRPTRRQFAKTVAGAAFGAFAAPAIVRGRNLNEKLNIAMIGSGGRGAHNLKQFSDENIVVLCDVKEVGHRDGREGALAGPPLCRLPPGLRPRQQLRRRGREHHRAHARLRHAAGLATGQARLLREAADVQHRRGPDHPRGRRQGQGGDPDGQPEPCQRQLPPCHRADPDRRIGPVSEAHVWVSRAWGRQPTVPVDPKRDPHWVTNERPQTVDPVPTGVDWDLWLGPAPARPFNNAYLPGPRGTASGTSATAR